MVPKPSTINMILDPKNDFKTDLYGCFPLGRGLKKTHSAQVGLSFSDKA